MISTVVVSLLLSSYVSAHGWMASVTIEGTTYLGNTPNASPNRSVIRQINDVDPVKGASNPFMNCGQDAQLAAEVATANPGDQIQFSWVNGDAGPWVHNVGPMQTYMTSCGTQNCASFNSSDASWFKISEQGRITTGGDWFMSNMNSGAPANVTIPANIAPGNYLIRHELIALQIAQTPGGAEFYPSCVQVAIAGNGTGAPTAEETVQLPGAYSDSDPGLVVDVYSNRDADYIFPGPPVAAFVNATFSATNSSSNPSPDSTVNIFTPPTAVSSADSSATSSSCMDRREVNDDAYVVRPAQQRPRTLSRVMKSLVSQ
ncbi:glycosyl hydrolase family 61-domain-containing protein [Rhodocollybia butyracea]|uniref:lytic cellulose monooxygenase (C4-dehydrogenating) n=1 Tax=Rhodocollybia butyracea TaxID=206335 RepID=A0A9P5UCX4_9AGAR|nr:glycosyl hydrolase family 61-domain-containing protein [Rhodocollybia butyracea]